MSVLRRLAVPNSLLPWGRMATLMLMATASAAAGLVPTHPSPPGLEDRAKPPVEVPFEELKQAYRPRPPTYPLLARLAGITGEVRLSITLAKTGRPERVEATEGPLALRRAAEAHLKRWRFEPYLVDGAAATVKTNLSIGFKLGDSTPSTLPAWAVLALVNEASHRSSPLDLAALKGTAEAALKEAGMQVVERNLPPEADPQRAVKVDLMVQTLRTPTDVHAFNINLRCSRLSDAGLKENIVGKEQRVWFFHDTGGQRGEKGFQQMVSDSLRDLLGNLADLRLDPASMEATMRAQVESTWAGGKDTGPQRETVDFDFSQVRIRKQPRPPSYPVTARERGVEGNVVVQITVDPEGRPARAVAVEGPAELLLTAISYALSWEFEPASLNGVPVWAKFKLTMPFKLNRDSVPIRDQFTYPMR